MRCAECGNELRETAEAIVESYKGESFTIDGIRHFQCDACGEYEISLDEADRLSLELASRYASEHGLLRPSEIKAIRKSLGMTQSEFENLIGVSAPTCCRWENGSSQQSRPADKLMRVIRDMPEVVELLQKKAGASHAEVIRFAPAKVAEKRVILSLEERREG